MSFIFNNENFISKSKLRIYGLLWPLFGPKNGDAAFPELILQGNLPWNFPILKKNSRSLP